MEESDDESSEEEMDTELGTLDQSQLITDEEDRKKLEAMPEFEREAILAERFDKRKAEHDMRQALREEKRKDREEKKALGLGKKRKTSTSVKKPTKKSKDDTSKDKKIALEMSSSSRRSSTRDRDATGKKDSKAKALAALREVSIYLRFDPYCLYSLFLPLYCRD
jgi:RNA polymerase-associated protein RTF1